MNLDIELSILTPESPEFNTIAKWQFDEWAHYHDNHTFEKRIDLILETSIQKEINKIPCTWTAKIDGQLAGTMALIEDDLPSRPDLNPWFASLYVHPEFRKKGLGSYLCQFATEKVREWGYEKLYLYTPDQEKLYQKLGYQTIERSSLKGDDIVVMGIDFKNPIYVKKYTIDL